MSHPHDGDNIRDGRTGASTRVRQQQKRDGVIAKLGSNEGKQVVYALVADQVKESNRRYTCMIKGVELEPAFFKMLQLASHNIRQSW